MDYRAAIDQLDRDLRQFQVEVNRYFAGALEMPPEAFENELATRVRELRGRSITSTALQFRLNSLTDRFRSLRELFRRRLREEESGARKRTESEDGFEPDARNGVVIDGSPSAAALRALHDALYRGRRGGPASLDAFRTYLTRQVDSIRGRTGCSQVRFRVDASGDRPRLKALPLHEERS